MIDNEKERVNSRLKSLGMQFLKFIMVSGVGWLIDFGGYFILSSVIGITVGISNFLSAIPSITYVFFLSTKKIFTNSSKLPLYLKYIVYFLYQLCLLTVVSLLSQYLYNWVNGSELITYAFIANHLKIIIKIVITPITMTCNFVVMKFLAEKL